MDYQQSGNKPFFWNWRSFSTLFFISSLFLLFSSLKFDFACVTDYTHYSRFSLATDYWLLITTDYWLLMPDDCDSHIFAKRRRKTERWHQTRQPHYTSRQRNLLYHYQISKVIDRSAMKRMLKGENAVNLMWAFPIIKVCSMLLI